MQEPANVTQTFSRERTPTVWRIIPTLEFLIKRWETMSTQPRYDEIKEALSDGVEGLKKWFHRAETSSDAYFICLGMDHVHHCTAASTHGNSVLDPNIKDVYFKSRWTDEQYKKGIKGLEKAVCSILSPPRPLNNLFTVRQISCGCRFRSVAGAPNCSHGGRNCATRSSPSLR